MGECRRAARRGRRRPERRGGPCALHRGSTPKSRACGACIPAPMKSLLRALPARIRRAAARPAASNVPRKAGPDAFERAAVQPAAGSAGRAISTWSSTGCIRDHVARPPSRCVAESSRARAHGFKHAHQRRVSAAAGAEARAQHPRGGIHEPGDPLRLDYGYR